MEGGSVLVENGIELGMAHVGVLGVQGIPTARELCPGQLAVRAAPGEAVVADAQDDLVLAHYACPNLQAWEGMLDSNPCWLIYLPMARGTIFRCNSQCAPRGHLHNDLHASRTCLLNFLIIAPYVKGGLQQRDVS